MCFSAKELAVKLLTLGNSQIEYALRSLLVNVDKGSVARWEAALIS